MEERENWCMCVGEEEKSVCVVGSVCVKREFVGECRMIVVVCVKVCVDVCVIVCEIVMECLVVSVSVCVCVCVCVCE